MSDEDRPDEGSSLFKEVEVIEYQAVSGLAVVGCLLGLLAAGALIWPLLWVVPPLAIVVNLIAIVRINRQPSVLVGKKFALVGLALAVFLTAMVPADKIAYDVAIRRQARHFASIWFDCLRDDKAIESYQLTLDPRYRRPLSELDAQVRVPDSEPRKGLQEYLEQSEVRCLLALGDKALVRYYATEGQTSEPGRDTVIAIYAVTYEEEGQKKSFFIRLGLDRRKLPVGDDSDWFVASSRGGYHPIALGGEDEY